MIVGTLFTLFVVPSIYMLIARTHAPAEVEDESLVAGVPAMAAAGQ
jgi:hypothetical protein